MSATKARSAKLKVPEGKQYAWRSHARGPVPAHVVGPELERLAANDGTAIEHLKPAHVVDESRAPDAVLHPAFEWRDEVAAEEHRKSQARALIRNIVTVEVVGNGPRQATEASVSIEPARKQVLSYVHVNSPDVGHCYMPTASVMATPDLRKQALAEAIGQLRGLQRRYEHLTELGEVFAAIDRLSQQSA